MKHSEGFLNVVNDAKTRVREVSVAETQQRMRRIADSLRAHSWPGATGIAIRNVVSIGIGGSDLGPRLVCNALARGDAQPAHGGITMR